MIRKSYLFCVIFIILVLSGCATTKRARILTDPTKADIIVNHTPVGTSPLDYEFVFSDQINVYNLEAKKEGYVPERLIISKDYFTNNPSGILKIKLKPLVCKFNLVTSPLKARVYLDGQLVGNTPLTINLVFGNVLQRSINIEKEGYLAKELVISYMDCHEGFLNRNVVLEPRKIKITFITRPEGAKVYLDGNFIGVTPVSKDIVFGDKIEHTVIFIKDGYHEKIVDFGLKDIEKKKKILVTLEKLEYKILPKLEIKYQPEEEKFYYVIELAKGYYKETVETSPNVSRVESIISEKFSIGKIDVYNDKIVYTKIYPKSSTANTSQILQTRVRHIVELKKAILYLQKMLQDPQGYKFFKKQIETLVYLPEIDKNLSENLKNIVSMINSSTDIKDFSNEIKALIQEACAILEKIRRLETKKFSSEIWMTTVKRKKIRLTYSGNRWIDRSPSIYEDLVYFSSNRESLKDFDIWRININKPSGLTKITNFPYSKDFFPSVDKKTGKIIAFQSLPLDALEEQIWTINVDGTLPSQLKIGMEPNILGDKIVYVRKEKGKKQIWVMNINGSGETLLTDDTFNCFNPSFSPDGKWIVYVCDNDGNKDLYIKKSDGSSNQIQLTTSQSDDIYPVWGADGYIYFVSTRGGVWGIWRLKPNI